MEGMLRAMIGFMLEPALLCCGFPSEFVDECGELLRLERPVDGWGTIIHITSLLLERMTYRVGLHLHQGIRLLQDKSGLGPNCPGGMRILRHGLSSELCFGTFGLLHDVTGCHSGASRGCSPTRLRWRSSAASQPGWQPSRRLSCHPPTDSTWVETVYVQVVAVGPGPIGEDGSRKALSLTTGSTVLYSKFAGNEFKGADGSQYVVLRAGDVMGVLS